MSGSVLAYRLHCALKKRLSRISWGSDVDRVSLHGLTKEVTEGYHLVRTPLRVLAVLIPIQCKDTATG
jgi:hypothetical protein